MAKRRGPGRPKGSKNKKQYEDEYDEYEPLLSAETKRGIAIVFLLTFTLISILSLFDVAGVLGQYIALGITYLFGWATWLFPIILIGVTYLLFVHGRFAIGFINYFGLFLFTISITALMHLSVPLPEAIEALGTARGGGFFGLFLSWPFQKVMGIWATVIVLVALLIVAFMITFNTSLTQLAEKSVLFNSVFERLFNRQRGDDDDDYYEDEEEEEEDEEPEDEEDAAESVEAVGEAEATASTDSQFSARAVTEEGSAPLLGKRYKKIDVPLDLLVEQTDKPSAGDITANQEKIQKTLEMFGIDVDMADVSVGPTVTQYTLKPAQGVKLSQITTLHNDLALALAAHPIRIEAPIPGKSLVGIEVPNHSIATVGMREVLSSKDFVKGKSSLMMALGKDVAGKVWSTDLASMPHLLIAGATGSGKSVCINTIITSLLYQNSPNSLRMILVDPKRVELSVYNGIPHLLTPVITDPKKTVNALKWAITEMDRRYELLSKLGYREIKSYNKAHKKEQMPYLVFVIDELADLMQVAGNEVEGYIIRLAQLARAVGIHLILATQRPSVNVITGLIKANITSRISFAVAASTDSRTILDFSGAEKLLGRGDMLFISANLSKPKRIQGAFISDDETRRVVEYIKGQLGEVEYDETITEKASGPNGDYSSGEDGDELFEEAKQEVLAAGKASASFLQRRLKVGYARAARLIDLLEEAGIVGPAAGAKPREILVSMDDDMPVAGTLLHQNQPAEEDDSAEEEWEDEESDEGDDDYDETESDDDEGDEGDEGDEDEADGEEEEEDEDDSEESDEMESDYDDEDDEDEEGEDEDDEEDDINTRELV